MAEIVDIRVRLDDVEKGIAAMRANGRDLSRVFRAARVPARDEQREHAAKAEGSTGPWPPRVSTTVDRLSDRASRVTVTSGRRRSKKGRGAIIRTTARAMNPLGRLPTTVVVSARKDELIARSPVKWSGAQQEGATVGRGAVLPAREFLWWSEAFLSRVAAAIEAHVVAPWDQMQSGGGIFSSVRTLRARV